jgi:predicted dehydrogenase
VVEQCHLPALAGLGRDVEVVAAVDADEHRLRRVAGMFEIAERLTSLEQLLGRGP